MGPHVLAPFLGGELFHVLHFPELPMVPDVAMAS